MPALRTAGAVGLSMIIMGLSVPSSAAAQQTVPLRGCEDLGRLPGLVWKGTAPSMTLAQLAAYAAPVFWLSPDEPTMRPARGRDIRVPAALPFEAQPDSPVVYYQFNSITELPDAGGPSLQKGTGDLGQTVVDLRRISAVQLKYIAYFPEEAGVGQHLHDVEPTEFRLLVGSASGDLAKAAGFVCDEDFVIILVVRVTGEAHGNRWYYNVLDVDNETTLPIHLLVEEGKHATATDKNADGYYTPGYDVSVRPNDAWGIRDTIRGGTLFTGKFESWMAKVRQDQHRVLPPLPADSLLVRRLADEGGETTANAAYELRPFPSSTLAAGDPLLEHKMKEKEQPGWPLVQHPAALVAPLEDWFKSDLELKPFSLAYRYDGAPGLSVAAPFFFVKNLNEPLSGGYIVHRFYAKGHNLRDWGWMMMYTPSASRWFDQYIAGGVETLRFTAADGTVQKKRDFVLETGVKFRFRAPSKALSWPMNFWGLRAGVRSVGAMDITHLGFVIELGAGVW